MVVILRRISIHALREEGDSSLLPVITPLLISIHALREEGDSRPCRCNGAPGYFYPLPPRGGRPRASARRKRSGRISIHALREEGD